MLIHAPVNFMNSYFLIYTKYSILYIYYLYFIQLFGLRYLICFQVLCNVNSAAMNIDVLMSFTHCVLGLLENILRSGIAELYGNSNSSLLKNNHFLKVELVYFPLNSIWGCLFFPNSFFSVLFFSFISLSAGILF